MAINFNELPTTSGFAVPPKGNYLALVEVAEMKQGQNMDKPPYLNLRLALTDPDGTSHGKIFDIISESEHEVMKFKLRRFIEACEIPITGNFDLKDLVKILPGKQIIVQTTIEPAKDGRPEKGTVNIFAEGVYYPKSKMNEIFGIPTVATTPTKPTAPTPAPATINAADAEDDAVEVFGVDPIEPANEY